MLFLAGEGGHWIRMLVPHNDAVDGEEEVSVKYENEMEGKGHWEVGMLVRFRG